MKVGHSEDDFEDESSRYDLNGSGNDQLSSQHELDSGLNHAPDEIEQHEENNDEVLPSINNSNVSVILCVSFRSC